jgi:hypothetical protein
MSGARRVRLVLAAMVLCAGTACTGGINAGEEGGLAFIVFTGMLLATIAVLWIVLGRED